MTEAFSLLQALLESGNYSVIIDQIAQELDLETLHNLSLVNKSCYGYFRDIVKTRTIRIRQSWLNSKSPFQLKVLQETSITCPTIGQFIFSKQLYLQFGDFLPCNHCNHEL